MPDRLFFHKSSLVFSPFLCYNNLSSALRGINYEYGRKTLQIGSLTLAPGALFAPMAGLSDASARRLMTAHGAVAAVSEMVSAKALTYGDKKTAALLRGGAGDAPYGIQLFGSEPDTMAKAAKLVLRYHPDYIDINMGCPAPKITATGAGSALMRDPALCGRIVAAVCGAMELPVTVKIRKGWDDETASCVEVARCCAAAGAAAIAIHGRTREQMYTPPIDPGCIAAVKAAVSVPVIGNGDITSAADALALIEQTGCDAVMVGRGALGNPWLFEEIRAALTGKTPPPPPDLRRRMRTMCEQLYAMCEEKGESLAMRQARSQAPYYMRGLRGAAQLRRAAVSLTCYRDAEALAELALSLNPGQ